MKNQKTSDIRPSGSCQKTVAVIADGQNINLWQHNEVILSFVFSLGEVTLLWAYHHWRSISRPKEQKLWDQRWQCLDIVSKAKNALDRQAMDDFNRICPHLSPDILVLVTNDGGFAPFIRHHLQAGRKVIVIGRRGDMSHRLLKLLPNDIYFIEDLYLSVA
jgi:hypothetical protein